MSALMNDAHADAPTQVFVVDDHPSICSAIADAIRTTRDMEVSGSAHTVADGFSQIEAKKPDVAILDISLEDGHGLDLVENIGAQVPNVQLIVFSMYNERLYAERAIRAGASGYLMKKESVGRLLEAIRTVMDGDTVMSDELSNQILKGMMHEGASEKQDRPIDELTDRELEVFQMLGQGRNVKDIEESLSLSRKTIESYRRRAKDKLGFDTVSELLRYAVQWTHGRGTNGPDADGQEPLLPQEKVKT